MKQTRRFFLGSAALALLGATATLAPQAARSQADLLDGKVFVTTEGGLGKPADIDNVMTFSGGLFHSKACGQWGYDKGTVKATRVGDAIHFETETRSAKYETRQVWRVWSRAMPSKARRRSTASRTPSARIRIRSKAGSRAR